VVVEVLPLLSVVLPVVREEVVVELELVVVVVGIPEPK
jgi:hypothetical protein